MEEENNRLIACDENVIRNSGIAGFVYRFDPPSRCNIYRTSKFIQIVLFLPSGNFFFDGMGKISQKRKPAAAGYS